MKNNDIFRLHQQEYEKLNHLQSELKKKSKELKITTEKAEMSEKNLQAVEDIMTQVS